MAKAVKTRTTVADNVLELERLIKKLIRKGFKDSTLDYTVQVAVTSLEPGKVKYGFMITGLKKEIDLFAQSYDSFAAAKAVLEGLIEKINPEEVEKTFHKGRINVYKNAISSHEERLKEIEEHGIEEDDGIEMEEV